MYGGNYPAFTNACMAVSRKNLNQSMQETQRLLTEGKTLQEIAEQRKIKPSTIHDHLLELAIQGSCRRLFILKRRQYSKTWLKQNKIRGCGVSGLASARSDAF